MGEEDAPLVERYSDEQLAKLKKVSLGPPASSSPVQDYFAKVLPKREKLGQLSLTKAR